jgi:putative ABC transport system permease protein
VSLVFLALKNAFRNRVRLALTALAVAVALTAFVAMRTAVKSYEDAVEYSRRDRVVTRHRVSFVLPLPERYVSDLRELRAADGEPFFEHVSFASWFGGRVPGREQEFFSSTAIDPAAFFDVYDEMEVDPAVIEAFRADRTGAIVGADLAERMGWSAGDRVTLESPLYPEPESGPWTFTITGTYQVRSRTVDARAFLFHWQRLDETLRSGDRHKVGWIVSRASSPERAREALAVIDPMFEASDVPTTSQDERAFTTGFMGMVSAVLDAVNVLSLVILVVVLLVLANAISMSVRERSKEHATLAAIGFGRAHVAALVLIEALVVAAIGGMLGLASAYGLVAQGLGPAIESELASIFPNFDVAPITLAIAFLGALVLGLGAAAVPAAFAARLRVTDALRRVA